VLVGYIIDMMEPSVETAAVIVEALKMKYGNWAGFEKARRELKAAA
jgi:hypothetical protein